MRKGTVDLSPIYRLLDNIEGLSDDRMWLFAAGGRRVRDEIVRLNTEDQLFEKGIRSTGTSLGPYRQFTVDVKLAKTPPQRVDHVTLKDTGYFYSTFQVYVDFEGWLIEADDEKGDKALFEVYGIDVLGLTDENKQRIKAMVLPLMIDYVRQQILR